MQRVHRPSPVPVERAQRRPRGEVVEDGGAGGAGGVVPLVLTRHCVLWDLVRARTREERVRDPQWVAVRLDEVAALDVWEEVEGGDCGLDGRGFGSCGWVCAGGRGRVAGFDLGEGDVHFDFWGLGFVNGILVLFD